MTRSRQVHAGELTREAALKEARRIFIDGGDTALSMRQVAQACEISLGHLQHFFPTRSTLVAAMLQRTVDDYIKAYLRFLTTLEFDALGRLTMVLRYLIEDSRNPDTSSFFIELWSLARRDPVARDILQTTYRRNCTALSPLLAAVRTDLTAERVRVLTLQVVAFLDGIIVYWYSERPSDADFADLADTALSTAHKMIAEAS